MRAALPHLRLMTLSADKFSPLSKFLTAEEKIYLSEKLFFKEESSTASAPLSLNTNSKCRTRTIFLNYSTFEIIPENLIMKGYSEMDNQDLVLLDSTKVMFCWQIDACVDLTLKGVEILTRAKIFPSPKNSKVARYLIKKPFCNHLATLLLSFAPDTKLKMWSMKKICSYMWWTKQIEKVCSLQEFGARSNTTLGSSFYSQEELFFPKG